MSIKDIQVSVGILSYNRPALLPAAIEGILSQTHENLQIVISDNGSPDPVVGEIIKKYAAMDSRIEYYLHSEDMGPYEHGQFVFQRLTNKYWMYACDDDIYYPRFIEKTLQLHELGSYAVVAAQCESVDTASGRKFMGQPVPSETCTPNKEDSFFNYLQLHHRYYFKGPIFLWGLYNKANSQDVSQHGLGLLNNKIAWFGTDVSYALHNIAAANAAFIPEVLWLRNERFYWGPGCEPWKKNLWKQLVHSIQKLSASLQYRSRFFLGKVDHKMISVEIYCALIRYLVREYGFDAARAEEIIGRHKADWIFELCFPWDV